MEAQIGHGRAAHTVHESRCGVGVEHSGRGAGGGSTAGSGGGGGEEARGEGLGGWLDVVLAGLGGEHAFGLVAVAVAFAVFLVGVLDGDFFVHEVLAV